MKNLNSMDDTIDEDDYRILKQKVAKIKSDLLFEEPCSLYESDESDWDDFWYGENIGVVK